MCYLCNNRKQIIGQQCQLIRVKSKAKLLELVTWSVGQLVEQCVGRGVEYGSLINWLLSENGVLAQLGKGQLCDGETFVRRLLYLFCSDFIFL